MRSEIPFRMPDGSTNWLQPGSRAHLLHTEGKAKDLIVHMKDVQVRHDALVNPQLPMPEWIQKLVPEGGFKRGELIVIVGARSTGKTMLTEALLREAQEKARG